MPAFILLLLAAGWHGTGEGQEASEDGLSALRQRLASGNKVRLAFYGASHTASDGYTHPIREALQRRYGNGGFGLFLPASPFPFYERRGVSLSGRGFTGFKVRYHEREPGPYGPMGFGLESNERATARAEFDEPLEVDEAAIAFEQMPDGGRICVTLGDDEECVRTRGPGRTRFVALEYVGLVERVRVRATGHVRLYGLSLERTRGVVVDSFGVPGARADDQLPWSSRSLRQAIDQRPIDLAAFAYGTNESARAGQASDRPRLRQVVRRLSREAPSCALIGPGEWPRFRRGEPRPRPRTLQVIAQQRRVAEEFGCAFFDTYAWMGAPGVMARLVPLGLAQPDHVHFTDAGYERLGRALTAWIEGRAVPTLRLPAEN
ncbi:MAG: GDSL-type esterase/lipase family protein [Myxococcota bacterium]